MAMTARNAENVPCWFYPDDAREAREIIETYGAVPLYPWPESGAPSPVFPWSREQVRNA
jgi:hypothetical protein